MAPWFPTESWQPRLVGGAWKIGSSQDRLGFAIFRKLGYKREELKAGRDGELEVRSEEVLREGGFNFNIWRLLDN